MTYEFRDGSTVATGMSWWEMGLFLGNRSVVALAFLAPEGRTWVVLPRSYPQSLGTEALAHMWVQLC